MTTAEDARKLRDWILENAGLEAQSMPVAIRILRLMDRDRWEAYAREHTLSTWEEGVELVLSYLEAAINEPAAQVACPPAEGECLLSPSPPAEGKCLLSPSPPAEGKCLLVLPPQPKWEEPECPQPKWEEPECPQPKRAWLFYTVVKTLSCGAQGLRFMPSLCPVTLGFEEYLFGDGDLRALLIFELTLTAAGRLSGFVWHIYCSGSS
ncbi:UNVERIFIED_CONTAM: hypothetical protein FKN15_044600 [Acipenser sinensis]